MTCDILNLGNLFCRLKTHCASHTNLESVAPGEKYSIWSFPSFSKPGVTNTCIIYDDKFLLFHGWHHTCALNNAF